jgi:conjugative relaxase-like TrwC/TraI family protein
MTVSMRVMSAGDGYKYLLRTIAAADGDRSLSTPLTRYYTEEGTPPGTWMGSALHSLGDGELTVGDEVSEAQLQLLIGMGRDPITGDPLGRAFPKYAPVSERIDKRVAGLDAGLGMGERAEQIAQIEAEETERGNRRAVAGFDYTFSVPKSVSVLWGVADAGTQALIAQAHHEAVAEVLDFMEREVAATRTGFTAADGAVAQVDVTGLIATAFDHYDSRSSDPQLHTHVVVSNKVQTVLDGKWRSLDGRPMHAAVVALSEHYNAVLADRLTGSLGLGWETRDRGRDRNPAWEIVGVSEELIEEFSTRAHDIDAETDRLIAAYTAEHGRRPSARTIVRLRAQATLATRPEKQVRSLADLTAGWRERAGALLGEDATAWANRVTHTGEAALLRADDVPLETVAELGQAVVEAVGEKRSTWRRWNLHSEASRQTMGWRFATAEDREAVVGMITDAAEAVSLRLTPPELATSPVAFRRADGSSVFRPKHSTVFSSETLLAAEDRLLDHANTRTGPTVDVETVERITSRPARDGRMLGPDQADALTRVAVSGRVLDVLVGPAGAGKTTAMNALRRAWEKQHGPGSVIGLAPSAVAAGVLGDDLGIATENTAKWWQNHLVHGTTFAAGQLVIIDEASLSLDRITALAAEAGAKVLLVGDYGQLQSVDAGGAFGMLVAAREEAPELVEVHRFVNEWEKAASLDLRHGRTRVIDTYLNQGRIHDGEAEDMIDAAYAAWRADREAGRASVLIAETRDDVTALNARARADLILDGTITPSREVTLNDGTRAGVGDTIITRRNDRRLRSVREWVRNGDRWQITDVRDDGSVTIRKPGRKFGAIVLPADYVAEHVDLGYAVTAHRAQGITVDTSHVLVEPTTTRENFYVAMTRGKQSNRAYVVLDRPDDAHSAPHPSDNEEATGRSVLFGVLQHSGAELSAHETITAEQDRWGSIAQLAAEYETIASAAQHDRWATLIRTSGMTGEQADAALASEAFGALTAELRRAEANHHDVDALFPRLVAARGFSDAEDIAKVMHYRLARATSRPAGSGRTRKTPALIVGLIPHAAGPMTSEMRHALTERQGLIEARADAILDTALQGAEPWTDALGQPPTDERALSRWRQSARTVAAYRDRYGIDDDTALGARPESASQKIDHARAQAALRRLTPRVPGALEDPAGRGPVGADRRGPSL